ncbi:MAG: hypothetical protein KBF88_15340, partial [Polyangiaceae bacterium]|nr:hypothetical protein [Polyangiaceae bacterium]
METGNAKYDGYFRQVHEIQVSSANWHDDHRNLCGPLLEALKLTPDAADVTITQSTYERVTLASKEVGQTRLDVVLDNVRLVAAYPVRASEATRDLFRSIEKCAHNEMLRVKSMRQMHGKMEEVMRSGRELENTVRSDLRVKGGKNAELTQDELKASLEVLSSLDRDAERIARAAEDFVRDLQRAVKGDTDHRPGEFQLPSGVAAPRNDPPSEAPAPPVLPKKPAPKEMKPVASPAAKPAPKVVAPKPAPPKPVAAAASPAPKPAAKPKPAGNAFE